jgi:hypothetical protein
MSNILNYLAPIVTVSSDHEPVKALRIHRDFSDKVTHMDVHPYVPALIAEHSATSPEHASKLLLKQLRELPVTEVQGANGDQVLLAVLKLTHQVAANSKRGAGNHALMSLATYDKFMNSTIEPAMPVMQLHVSEMLADDEIIVAYFSQVSTVDAGIFIAEFTDANVLQCTLPNWDKYYAYGKIK